MSVKTRLKRLELAMPDNQPVPTFAVAIENIEIGGYNVGETHFDSEEGVRKAFPGGFIVYVQVEDARVNHDDEFPQE